MRQKTACRSQSLLAAARRFDYTLPIINLANFFKP